MCQRITARMSKESRPTFINIMNFYVFYIGALYSIGARNLALKALLMTLTLIIIGAYDVDIYGLSAHNIDIHSNGAHARF